MKETTTIYLIRFSNKKTGWNELIACSSMYDNVYAPRFIKDDYHNIEYKDIDEECLKKNCTLEKKEKIITF